MTKFKGYITKYTLTRGIIEAELEVCVNPAWVQCSALNWKYYHGEGKDWHRTYESAQIRAEEMRLNKIASLEKSLAKMRALRFDGEPIK